MERFVLILDDFPDYARALAAFLNESRDFPYRVIPVTTVEEAYEYIDSGAVGTLLISSCYEKAFTRCIGRENLQVFFLTEDRSRVDAFSFYRYGYANRIRERLCRERESVKKLPILCVYSPLGEAELEALGRGIAKGLSRYRGTVFLPFLPFGLFDREREEGMSELFYFSMQGEEKTADFFSRQQEGIEGAVLLSCVRWKTDLQGLTAKQLQTILSALITKTSCSVLVAAIAGTTELSMELLKQSIGIFVPVSEEGADRYACDEFTRQLLSSGEQEVAKKVIRLPFFGGEKLNEAIAEGVKKGGEVLAACQRRTEGPGTIETRSFEGMLRGAVE